MGWTHQLFGDGDIHTICEYLIFLVNFYHIYILGGTHLKGYS